MLDFASPSFATAPDLADAVIDEAKMEACRVAFPGSSSGF
jgi:hypothetical protein